MDKKSNKLAKAQTALEYLGVSVVFAGVGIGSFLAINQATLMATRGSQDNYGSGDTLLGKTLNDGTADTALPEDWSQPQEGLDGALPEDIAEAGAVHESDWESTDEGGFLAGSGPIADEDNFLAGTGAGDHWTSDQADDSNLDLPDAENAYTSTELQGEFNTVTDQYFSQHEAGYTDEGIQQINENLNDGWFMSSVEPSRPGE